MKRWIKFPGPGQVRGEGEWREVDPKARYPEEDVGRLSPNEYWEWCRESGYLPTAEQDEVPEDE